LDGKSRTHLSGRVRLSSPSFGRDHTVLDEPPHSEPRTRQPPQPREPQRLIERHRLDHVYQRARGRLLRVLAPSGFGKSTLVARWVASDTRRVRWVDLDRSDDDPVALFGTLRRALADIYDIPVPSTAHATAVNPYVRALEEGLSGSPSADSFVLVLDDVHRIRTAEGSWLIRTVVEHLVPGSTVVLIGRGHHDHGTLGRLRLAPGVVDVTVDDLSFDRSETHRLLEELGVDAGAPDVADVMDVLEGWPAGVRLAGEVLRTAPVSKHITHHVSLVDYLRDEWLAQLDEDDRAFLREVACLERFSGEMCDEVLDRLKSSEVLERLHRHDVMVLALDQRSKWYRLHRLLQHRLSVEQKDLDPQRWVHIHRRAASYWEQLGDIDRAVEHVRAVGDMVELERLVTVHGGRFFTTGRDQTVTRWLAAFSADDIQTSPGLSGLQCVKALHRGDEMRAVQWLRLHDDAVRGRGGPGEEPTTWWANVLHAALDERPAADLIPGVAASRVQLAGGPWAGFACWVHGGLSFVDGDLETAQASLLAGAFEAELNGNEMIVGHCLATMSVVDDCVGDDTSAAANARRANEAIVACGAELSPQTAPVMAVLALQHARHGNRDGAVQAIAAARGALTGYRTIAPWFNLVTRLALVRTVLILDDRTTGRELIRELEHHARFEPRRTEPVRSAIACVAELAAQVEAMHVQATGASALTDSELRVLRLLPTNLSLADIASQLYVSRNTVKTHVASIYRKLEADKRSEAVERARSAGLLAAPSRG
jgi:LuxR family transcriptional regulator, maltose regulon positive regulatory protein